MTELTLRPAAAADEEFLRDLRAGPLAAALIAAGVGADHVAAVIDLQHRARHAEHTARHPHGVDRVAEISGRPVGRVWTADEPAGGVLVLDIAVAQDAQRAGVGRMLLATVCGEADGLGVGVRATVERTNSASLALFTGSGFAVVGQDDLHVALERSA